jgi:quercetin dioxygenase-like cupin family protein
MRKLVLVSTVALLAAAPAGAKHRAAAMKWMDATAVGLPGGAKLAVVSGDPTKDSDFVVRAKIPANYTVPPHHHPTDEVVRVLSAGSLTYGMGDKVDTSNSGTLTKGYHVTMQAGMNHWVTATEPLEIQVSGKGPFEIVYVNPADDPRNK